MLRSDKYNMGHYSKYITLLSLSFLMVACGNWELSFAKKEEQESETPPAVSLSTLSQTVNESAGTATITVNLSRASEQIVSVPFSVNSITATATLTTDYSLSPSSPLTFNPGETSKTITVSIVNDGLVESDETIVLALGIPSGADLGAITTQTLTLANDDLVCNPAFTGSYGGGSGTVADPYTICSLAQWDHFGSNPTDWNKNFTLHSNLDFTGVVHSNFKSIGNSTTAFTGNFDGNNYKIQKLTLVATTEAFAIFSETNGNVEIRDLVLEDLNFTSQDRACGLILNHGASGTLYLKNLTASRITLKSTNNVSQVGAIVGNSAGPVVVETATLNEINLNSGDLEYSGGLIGVGMKAITVSDLTGTDITVGTGTAGGSTIGGLIGSHSSETLSLTDISLTDVEVKSMSYAAGVIAALGANTNVFTNVHVKNGSATSNSIAGGIFGRSDSFTGPSLTMTESSFDGYSYGGGGSNGGLGGVFSGNATITKSFVKGTITNWSGIVGGLFGQIGGAGRTVQIIDSYSTADVSTFHASSGRVGGLVFSNIGNVQYTRSYFAGTANANAGFAACIGNVTSATSFTTTDVYYNSTTCTQNASTSGAITGTLGLATGSFQTATAFSNWLSTSWTFTSGQNPKLVWEP